MGIQGIPFDDLKKKVYKANFDAITMDGKGWTVQDRFLVRQGRGQSEEPKWDRNT